MSMLVKDTIRAFRLLSPPLLPTSSSHRSLLCSRFSSSSARNFNVVGSGMGGPLYIDGRTGEGGGQLIRIACALAAVTSHPIHIRHVRGNRGGKQGGGLKAQHVAAIKWLAEATNAQVDGLAVGSHTFTFQPSLPPTALKERKFQIVAGNDSSSTLLVFQAVFPFLLFAGNGHGDPIELEIHGGTNTSFSPSYEYFDQVLLPALQDNFGINVERQLIKRSWTKGPHTRGSIWLKFQPLAPGQPLTPRVPWDKPISTEDFQVKQIDISILVPHELQAPLTVALTQDLNQLFPAVDVGVVVMEDSGHKSRIYTLLVAHSETGLRWGCDYMHEKCLSKQMMPEDMSSRVSAAVCKRLRKELEARGTVDGHLQDQLVVFQALADGRTSFYGSTESAREDVGSGGSGDTDALGSSSNDPQLEKEMRQDKPDSPFGEGLTHTITARWIASKLLPTVRWFNQGRICDGASVSFPQTGK